MLRRRFAPAFAVAVALILLANSVYAASLVYVKRTSFNYFIFDNVGNTVKDPKDAYWNHYYLNPVINGSNLYAPSIVKNGGTWNVYTGGWRDPGQVNDKIYLNTTTDPSFRTFKEAMPVLQVDGGSMYIHACDPSVVKRSSNLWVMAFTGYRDYDWIVITSSTDGASWSANTFSNRNYEVRFINKPTGVTQCARPSLNWVPENNRWEMFFDATVDGVSGQYVAYSTETIPRNFILGPKVGNFVDADIHKVGDKYIALYRKDGSFPWKIMWGDSVDGTSFTERGVFLEPDPLKAYCSQGVTNPGMAFDDEGNIIAVLFGGTSTTNVNNHKVGVAYPQCKVIPMSGDVYHIYGQGFSRDQICVDTFQYNTISKVLVYEKPGYLIVDQNVSSTKGDEWALIR